MKKLKIILFITTILLCCVFLFATCRKTKGLESSFYANDSFILTMSDSNNGAIFYYLPNTNAQNAEILKIYYTTQTESGSVEFYKSTERLYIYFNNNNGFSNNVDNLYFYTDTNKMCYFYIILGNSRNNNYSSFYINYGYKYFNGASITDVTKYYYFDNIPSQSFEELNYVYNSSTGLNVNPYSWGSSEIYRLKGFLNGYIYDTLDYSDTFSESVPDIKSDYLTSADSVYFSNLYTVGYNAGYTVGYQAGYDDGYADGQTAGYNSGYTAGYNAGVNDNQTAYDRGFDDGYADGYRAGVVYGYDNGYATGYNVGFTEGQAGATPVSKTIGVVSSIFAGIGEVLAVELFPGFTLGILILVPLFFGVLGLILWIWRRN